MRRLDFVCIEALHSNHADVHIRHTISWSLSPRQTQGSPAVRCGRHQQDNSCYPNVSRSGIYGRKPAESHSLCADRLHNGRSFCYLFLKLSLKPLFIAAPGGSAVILIFPSAKSAGFRSPRKSRVHFHRRVRHGASFTVVLGYRRGSRM